MKESYQERARMFCFHESDNLAYPLFGLYEETAELIEKSPIMFAEGWTGIKSRIVLRILVFIGKRLGKWAKKIRKGQVGCPFDLNPYCYAGSKEQIECKYELGDIHWMLVNLDSNYWLQSEDVEECNIDKLTRRSKKNQICDHPDH